MDERKGRRNEDKGRKNRKEKKRRKMDGWTDGVRHGWNLSYIRYIYGKDGVVMVDLIKPLIEV